MNAEVIYGVIFGGHSMFTYSEDGQHFLGCRVNTFGKVQVVYDRQGSKHRVYDVETPNVSTSIVFDTIKDAVKQKRVMPAVFAALSSKNIHLRESL